MSYQFRESSICYSFFLYKTEYFCAFVHVDFMSQFKRTRYCFFKHAFSLLRQAVLFQYCEDQSDIMIITASATIIVLRKTMPKNSLDKWEKLLLQDSCNPQTVHYVECCAVFSANTTRTISEILDSFQVWTVTYNKQDNIDVIT